MAYKTIVVTPQQVGNFTNVKTSQFYRGFSTLDPTTTNVKLYDYELVKQDLLNQFNTRKGERVMNPEFGSIIWDLIYEPLTDNIKQQIADDIDRILSSDPRFTPTGVNIVEQDYGFLIELTITYKNTNNSDSMILSFDRSVGLAA